jgi:hypothetical protein
LLLVQHGEELAQCRAGVGRGKRQRQFRIGAGVAQVDEPLEAMVGRAEMLVDKSCCAFRFEAPEHRFQRLRIEPVDPLLARAHIVMFHLGEQHAERTEEARHRRHHDPLDVEQARERGRMHGTIAAEGQHGEVARIASALGRHRAQRTRHRGVGDAMYAPRGVFQRKPERTRHFAVQRAFGEIAVDGQRAAGKRLRIDEA